MVKNSSIDNHYQCTRTEQYFVCALYNIKFIILKTRIDNEGFYMGQYLRRSNLKAQGVKDSFAVSYVRCKLAGIVKELRSFSKTNITYMHYDNKINRMHFIL
jgi:hypothetical protein